MKKIGFGIGVALLIIFSVTYYLNDKAQKHTIELKQLKEKVTQQLAQMSNNGFQVTDREMTKEKEHFFITIIDPNKASTFLTQRGLRITAQEAEELKDLKFNVDLLYLSDIFSLDIYPTMLPPYLKEVIAKETEKDILAQLEDMIQRKVFFMHVDIDHGGTTLQGHIKDIDESLQSEKVAKLQLKGFEFLGNIKDEKVVKLKQLFEHAHFYITNEINNTITGLQSSYQLTGPTSYDYTSQYSIKQLQSAQDDDNYIFAEGLLVNSTSKVENGLANETVKANVKNVELLFEKEKLGFQALKLDMNMSNIDIASLDKLQKTQTQKTKEVENLIESFVEKNIHLSVSNLSAEKIIFRGKEMGGFDLNANLDIDQSLDIYRLNIQRKHALNKISGQIHLSLSKEILDMLKKDGEFMIMYMMYRPKRELGQKIYDINIGDGEIKINGKVVDF